MRFIIRFLVLFLLLPALSASGQKDSVRADKQYLVRTFAAPPYGILILAYDDPDYPETMTLSLNGLEGGISNTKSLPLARRNLYLDFEKAYLWQGELHLFSSLYLPGPGRRMLLHRRFRLPSLELIDQRQLQDVSVPTNQEKPFHFSVSPDSSKLTVCGWSYGEAEDRPRIDVRVFEGNMQTAWESDYELPYRNESFYLYGCRVRNDGKVYLMGENYEGGFGGRTNLKKLERLVFFFEEGAGSAPVIRLPETDYTIANLAFTLDDAGRLIGGGFYQKGKSGSYEGIYYTEVDGPGRKARPAFISVDDDRYERAYTFGDKEPFANPYSIGDMDDYYVDEIHIQDDGGLLLVAEHLSENSNGVLVYGDILAVRIDAAQRLSWLRRISKRQESFYRDDAYQSYAFIRIGDYSLFLYNDHPENHGEERSGRLKVYRAEATAAILARIDAEGNLGLQDFTKQTPSAYSRYHLRPRFVNLYGGNRLICYAERRNGITYSGFFFFVALQGINP